MAIWIEIKDRKWADDAETYDYLMPIDEYSSAKEWQKELEKTENYSHAKKDWCQKFSKYLESDDHCPFCELLIPLNSKTKQDNYQATFCLDKEPGYVSLFVEKNEAGRLFFYGCGEEYSESYYPRYCPHCGKKL